MRRRTKSGFRSSLRHISCLKSSSVNGQVYDYFILDESMRDATCGTNRKEVNSQSLDHQGNNCIGPVNWPTRENDGRVLYFPILRASTVISLVMTFDKY